MSLHRSRVARTVRPSTLTDRLVGPTLCEVAMSNEKRPSQGASTRKHDVDALLADLSLDVKPTELSRKPSTRPLEPKPSSTRPDDAQSLLDDLEGLVQRRRSVQRDVKDVNVSPKKQTSTASHTPSPNSRPGLAPVRPMQRSSPTPGIVAAPVRPSPSENVSSLEPKSLENGPAPQEPATAPDESAEPVKDGAWGGWGNLFSTASKLADQARSEIGRRTAAVVPNMPLDKDAHPEQQIFDLGNKFAQRVRGFVQQGGLEHIRSNITAAGLRGWNDIVNAVVLPMEAHDSLHITVSHDMIGYDGIETLAFKVLSRVLSQAELDISVSHDTSVPSQELDPASERRYNLNAADTREQGLQHAKEALHRLCDSLPSTTDENDTSACPVILRIQPFYDQVLAPGEDDLFTTVAQGKQKQSVGNAHVLFFYVWWVDPKHKLSHVTQSQAVPSWWMSVSDAENQWVELVLSDTLENAIATVSQDYIQRRRALFAEATAAAGAADT